MDLPAFKTDGDGQKRAGGPPTELRGTRQRLWVSFIHPMPWIAWSPWLTGQPQEAGGTWTRAWSLEPWNPRESERLSTYRVHCCNPPVQSLATDAHLQVARAGCGPTG